MPDETVVGGWGGSIHDDREEKKLNPAQIPQARPSLATQCCRGDLRRTAAGTHLPHPHPPPSSVRDVLPLP